ncbi:MAG: replication-associated recombination protein A [Pseudomonadota bacterium]
MNSHTQSDLFDSNHAGIPFAERVRPKKIEEFIGQDKILGDGKPLKQLILEDKISSLIFWGPPGCGKTTLARIIANLTRSNFISISAILTGIKEAKLIMDEARRNRQEFSQKTILFIDEIHRFNKAQQDAFLPHVEKGNIILIGATTENPSFEVISPLLSRSRVIVFEKLQNENIITILKNAISRDFNLKTFEQKINDSAFTFIANYCNGDARVALNILEQAISLCKDGETPSSGLIKDMLSRSNLYYDKNGEEHYNIISALHKSMRNSDINAAIYWLTRMLESGEDPLYTARRMIRFAVEDVGLADPNALKLAVAAKDAYHFLGSPEGELALVELAIYLAAAPKSNSAYVAYKQVKKDIKNGHIYDVPLHLRNAPTELMKEVGYGKGYRYYHDDKNAIHEMDCLPEELIGRKYYKPSDAGVEARLKVREQELNGRTGEQEKKE